jgi:hypothetical protein
MEQVERHCGGERFQEFLVCGNRRLRRRLEGVVARKGDTTTKRHRANYSSIHPGIPLGMGT